MDAADLAASLRRGDVRAVEVMAATLDRIAALNPTLNAIVVAARPPTSCWPRPRRPTGAGARAGCTACRWRSRTWRPTRGLRTTWGSPIFAEHVPDARRPGCRARLRAAGAIFIGKTNVPEFGLGSHSFNPVFGVTRNP